MGEPFLGGGKVGHLDGGGTEVAWVECGCYCDRRVAAFNCSPEEDARMPAVMMMGLSLTTPRNATSKVNYGGRGAAEKRFSVGLGYVKYDLVRYITMFKLFWSENDLPLLIS